MKRGIVILLFVLLLACSVNAVDPDYVLDYDADADLSEAGGKWAENVSSPTFYIFANQANAIRIDDISITSDKLWLYFLGEDKEVFFEDSNGKTQSVNISDYGNDLILKFINDNYNLGYTLEWDGDADLNEAGGKWAPNFTSPTFYFHVSQANAIRIVEGSITADKTWMYNLGEDQEVFFEDSNAKTQTVNISDYGKRITFRFYESASSDSTPPDCSQSNTNITVEEDSGSWNLDSSMGSSPNISCADTNTLTYTINTQTGSGGTFSIASPDVLNFATGANDTGVKTVVIDVSDGTNTVQVSAEVNVSAVNDAPYLKEVIPDLNWSKGTTKKIELDDYFSDPDNGDTLTYNYTFTSSGANMNITIESNGDTTLTPVSGWTGTETVNFTAYDSANLSVTSNEVILTVYEGTTTGNQAPVIDTFTPTSDPTISVGGSQTFTITKSDPDGNTMNVSWKVNGVTQEGETGDSFTYTASALGTFPIQVVVVDNVASDVKSATHSWDLIVQSAQSTTNQTASPGTQKTGSEVSACGDEKCEGDEDQTSCCKDCGCPDGYECNANTNSCTQEKKSKNMILLAVVLGLFAGGAGVGLYLYKKKQEQEIFGGLANTSFTLPPKTGEVKKEEPIVKKPQEPVKKAVEEKPLKETKTTSQVLLKNFIKTNLAKGKSLEEIKEELHKVGWTDEQINDAYTAAQLDEAFS